MGRAHPIHSADQALERLAGLPGGAELIAAAKQREDIALVGGAVRDLLLGHWPRELDVTVESDAEGLAQLLAATVSPSERAYGHPVTPTLHDRFGTASVAWDYGRIDIAERRAEGYSAPGALPDVRPASVDEDLARRDFTVNAITLPLAGPSRGVLAGIDGALDDLASGLLRVLHDGSFIDDPTRILRLARYSARLRFEIEMHTRELALAAIAAGALDTVSGERIGTELWLAAGEADGAAALALLGELGVLAALGLPEPFDEDLAGAALGLLPHEGRRDLALMAVAFGRADHRSHAQLTALARSADRFGFTREQRDVVVNASIEVEPMVERVRDARTDAVAYAMLDPRPVEIVAVGAALADRSGGVGAARLREWLGTQRHVRLEIDGNDLLAAGVAEGPEIGARLRRALQRKREGAAQGREAELQAALEGEVRHVAVDTRVDT